MWGAADPPQVNKAGLQKRNPANAKAPTNRSLFNPTERTSLVVHGLSNSHEKPKIIRG